MSWSISTERETASLDNSEKGHDPMDYNNVFFNANLHFINNRPLNGNKL